MSAMRWLLNIAAFRSRTVGFVACQLGSCVQSPGDGRFNWVIGDDKEDKGDAGALRGWFTPVPSRCNTIDEESGLTDGGESDVLLGDSAEIKKKNFLPRLLFTIRYNPSYNPISSLDLVS